MKKIYRLLIIGLLLFNTTTIQALNLGEVTDGDSGSEDRDYCSWPNYSGCFWWSENFMIRVSLVDENFRLVEGTKTVEFSPLNPYSSKQYYETYDMDKSNSEYGIINPNRYEYNFVGSHIARTTDGKSVTGRYPELTADKGYYIYLGFGKNKAVANDFSDYAKNRESFIKYVTRLTKENYVQEIDTNVRFIDFFLKVSGYSNIWNTTETDKAKLKDLAIDHRYFLLIEPVYMYTQWNNGDKEYNARGTAKQLAAFYTQSSPRYANLFKAAATDLNVVYNHTCNFRDLSDNYSQMYKRAYYDDPDANVISNKQYEYMFKNACESINNMKKIDYRTYSDALKTVSYAGSGFGVNIIDIQDVFREEINNLEQASCTLSVDSCAKTSGDTVQPNDNFYIQTKLTNTEGKMANCILPNIASDEQLSEYIYSVGEGNNQLWCYDDITYDFSKLKSTLSDKNFSTNQLVEIPNGTLRVDRTCYTKSSDTNNIYLGTVFETDPGNYQDSFKFSFNNKELVFERNNSKYIDKNVQNTPEQECTGRNNRNCKYKYTSTFHYDYELKDSISAENLNINISDLSLNSGIKNTNSLEFITNYDKSKVTKIDNQYSTGTYTSSLSTQISNGYGLTNKLYEKLLSVTTDKKIENAGTENEIEVNRLSNNKVSELVKINLEQNSKKTCNVNTTIGETSDKSNGGSVFRVISLNNPFPARDGSSRLPGSNWLSKTDNNVYNYIENNRNVKTENKDNDAESVYKKEPLYTITLTPSTMVKIREYNKSHNYSNIDMTCESGTGRMCIDNFIRNSKYIPELNGTCKTLTTKEITEFNNRIREFELSGCNNQTQCMTMKQNIVNELDTNKDGYVTSSDYLNADFYTCADKTYRSGG